MEEERSGSTREGGRGRGGVEGGEGGKGVRKRTGQLNDM